MVTPLQVGPEPHRRDRYAEARDAIVGGAEEDSAVKRRRAFEADQAHEGRTRDAERRYRDAVTANAPQYGG